MVSWARKYGIQSTIHTGGPSLPGSGYMDKDKVLEADADADVIGHINGGHTHCLSNMYASCVKSYHARLKLCTTAMRKWRLLGRRLRCN